MTPTAFRALIDRLCEQTGVGEPEMRFADTRMRASWQTGGNVWLIFTPG